MRATPNVGWVRRLKAGDPVAVMDRGAVVYRALVKRITPGGFISLRHLARDVNAGLFYANGYFRDSVCGHRFLMDPAEVDVQGATKP